MIVRSGSSGFVARAAASASAGETPALFTAAPVIGAADCGTEGVVWHAGNATAIAQANAARESIFIGSIFASGCSVDRRRSTPGLRRWRGSRALPESGAVWGLVEEAEHSAGRRPRPRARRGVDWRAFRQRPRYWAAAAWRPGAP